MWFQLGVILTVVGGFALLLWVPEAGINCYRRYQDRNKISYGSYWSAYGSR